MALRISIIVAMVMLCFFPLGRAMGEELAEREAIENKVAKLASANGFAELESLAADYRDTKARTSSGLWRLTFFYNGIVKAFPKERRGQRYWSAAEAVGQEWVAAYPGSPTAHLAYATILLNHGWSFRGTGYVDSVAPNNWEPFYDYVDRARRYLEDHKAVAAVDPYWYDMMIEIAVYQNWKEEEFLEIVSEGLTLYPSYYQMYFSAVMKYFPKWLGESESIEKFALAAVERTKTTEGYGLYARIYWNASRAQYGDQLFSDSPVDWATMKRGIDDVLDRYPDPWNLNNFARFACLAKDRAKTAELIARIGTSVSPRAWGSPVMFRHCKTWALEQVADPDNDSDM